MSRRDKKPLAKGSRRPGDRPRGARPYAEKARSERGKGKPAFGERAGSKPVVRLGAAAVPRPARSSLPLDEPRKKVAEAAPLPTKVQTVAVTADEANMRVDRFLEARFPGLSFSHIQRVVRKGELRVDGKRADSKDRLKEGQNVRIPPLHLDAPKRSSGLSEADQKTLAELKAMTLFATKMLLGLVVNIAIAPACPAPVATLPAKVLLLIVR